MKLENRYVVLKLKDVDRLSPEDYEQLGKIVNKISKIRESDGKGDLECIVVEKDWPEFEPTFKLLEERVDGKKTV